MAKCNECQERIRRGKVKCDSCAKHADRSPAGGRQARLAFDQRGRARKGLDPKGRAGSGR